MDPFAWEVVYRATGTAGGVIIAYAMSNDAKSWQGLRRRLYVAGVCGFLLADPVGDYLSWDMQSPRKVVAASCVSAALGWWIMHAIIRILQSDWLMKYLPGNGRAKG